MTRISTRAANSILLNQNMRTQKRLFDAQVAMTSEKKTNVYQGVAIDSRRLVNLENTTSLLQRFNTNNEQMGVKLDVVNTSVQAIRESFTNFRDYLGNFDTTSKKGEVEVKDIQDQAFQALKAIEGYLNIDIDGQYLFSGNKVLTEPINLGLTTLDAFQTKFNGDTVLAATTRDAALENFSYNQDPVNTDAIGIEPSNFLKFRQDSADELTRLIYSLTAATATGSVDTISSETTLQPKASALAADVTTAAASIKETETITLSGDFIVGDVITVQIDSLTADTYTVNASDIGANSTATLSNIASGIASTLTGGNGSGVISATATAGAAGAVITITADTVNSAFTTTVDVANDVVTIESKATSIGGQTGSSLLTSSSTFSAVQGSSFTIEASASSTSSSSVFTVTATSTIDDLVTAISALDSKITASFNTTSGEIEIVGSGGLEFTFTDLASRVSNSETTAAAASVKEVETITLSGDYSVGDVISVRIDSLTEDVYTVTASDVAGNATANLSAIATSISAQIDAGNASSVIGASSTGAVITLTADTVNSAFTVATSSAGAAVSADTTAAGASTKEVETVTLSGAYIAGDTISITVDGNAETYTVLAADVTGNTTANLASIATAVTAQVSAGSAASLITATSSGAVITLTSDNTNSSIVGAAAATETTQTASTKEVDTITLTGDFSTGDTVSLTVDGTAEVYTVNASDIGGNTTATLANVAAGVAAQVGAGAGGGALTATSSSGVITLTADTVNVAIATTSVSALGSAGFTTVAATTTGSSSPQTAFQFGSGAGIMTSGVAQTFDPSGGTSDLLTTAFGATSTDTLTFSVAGGNGTTNSAVFTIGTQTVADLITQISGIDAGITASFNTTTKQIDITGNGGSILTFSDTGTALSSITFDNGASIIGNGGSVTYASTQSDSDTIVAAYGSTATDVLTMTLGNGATENFTIGNQTIAQLASTITSLDTTITASFNTATKQLDITSDVAGTAITFTNATGDPLTELQFNDGGAVASGETSTFTVDGLTKSSTITASSALFANLNAGSSFTVNNSASNNGTYQITGVSDDGRTITVNTRMLTDEQNVTPTITYRDPTDTNSTISLTADDFTDLSFSRSNDTIHAATADSLKGLPVGTSFTVTGTANNDGSYTILSNDGSDIVIESLKLNDEGLTTGDTYFDLQSNTDVNFDAATKTIEIRQPTTTTPVPNSFNGLIIGQPITLSGSVGNSGSYTVASISSDGSSITVNETIFDETDTDGIGIKTTNNNHFSYTSDTQMVFDATNETIQLTDNSANPIPNAFSGLSVGMRISADGMPTTGNNRTYTVASISADGSTITVKEDIGTSETDTDGARLRVFAASATIAANSYYSGDEQVSTHRVSTTQSFTRDIDGIDPAFEKGIRALQLIAQGVYGTAGGLDNNHQRVDDAIYLINSALQRAVTGTAPYGDEVAGNLEQVEIDLGYHQVLMQTTTEINLNMMAFFDGAVADIENVDMQFIVTQLLDDQNALEASYQAYSRISQLSLTKYL